MFFFYQLITFLIILISPFIIIFRIFKKKEHIFRFKEKFCSFSKKRGKGKLIWFHGSSVGEILSIIPLVEKLEQNKSIQKILITSSTLSSSTVLNKYRLKKTIHQFFPIDFIFFTNKFLDYWNPSLAIFIESEIWPSMFLRLKKKSIPLLLINARITKKTFKRWKKISFFSKDIFNKINVAYPQNLETFKYLRKLKVKKVKFLGNLKFTENKSNKIESLNKSFLKKFKNRKIWCAASTHADEELDCAKVHLNLKKKYKKLLTIIIPRHIYRAKEIMSKIEGLGLSVVNRNSKKKINDKTDIYLIDTYGETNKFYKICKIVFLGGSFIKHGGQNPIEPARLGSTILHGPYIDNFKDVYKLFHNKKISYKANNTNQLIKLVDRSIKNYKNDKNKYLSIKKIGNSILQTTTYEINKIIKNENQKT